MIRTSTKALLAYPEIKHSTRNLVEKIQRNTIGENEEYLSILVPFVTGEIKYQKRDTNVFYNFRDQSMGARYIFDF